MLGKEAVASKTWVDKKTLIQRSRAGDKEAYRQLMVAHQRLIYSVAYRIVQSEKVAADVVRATWHKAFPLLPAAAEDKFEHWLLSLLIHTCMELWKNPQAKLEAKQTTLLEKRPSTSSHLARTAQPKASTVRLEQRKLLELGICTLPIDQRIAIVLHDVQGYSCDEVAAITNAPIGRVKGCIAQGRICLRDFLEDKVCWGEKASTSGLVY